MKCGTQCSVCCAVKPLEGNAHMNMSPVCSSSLQRLFGSTTVFHFSWNHHACKRLRFHEQWNAVVRPRELARRTVFHFSWNQHAWERLRFHEKWNTVCAKDLSNASFGAQPCSTFHGTNMPGKGLGSMRSGTKPCPIFHVTKPLARCAGSMKSGTRFCAQSSVGESLHPNRVPLFMEPQLFRGMLVP